jgi:hypothetical protein
MEFIGLELKGKALGVASSYVRFVTPVFSTTVLPNQLVASLFAISIKCP